MSHKRYEPPRFREKWRSVAKKAACFDPQLILSVPLLIIILFLLAVEGVLYGLVRLTGRLVEKWSTRPSVRRLIKTLRASETFNQYKECAEKLDEKTGRNKWKLEETQEPCFDYELVNSKIDELNLLRNVGNISGLVDVLKSCLETGLCNTLKPPLFSMTYSGTKRLGELLHHEVLMSIDYLIEKVKENPQMDGGLLANIKRLQKDFGYTALVFSGGAMLGLHHLGLVEVLAENNLLPRIIAGTSAGSAIAALVCTRNNKEILEFIRDENQIKILKDPFEPNNWIYRFINTMRQGHSMDIEAWLKRSEEFVGGPITFMEAFQKTGRTLNISVCRAGAVGEAPLVLNHRNAPNVLIFTAIIASSAFPYLGFPVHLKEKDPVSGETIDSVEYSKRFYHDGSLRGDVPVSTLRDRMQAKFILVSQVNPHVFPFLGLRSHGTPGQPLRGWGSTSAWRGGFPLAVVEVALKEHLRFLLRVLALLEIAPVINGINMTHVALQEYGGDVNVYPFRFYWQHVFVFNNVPACLVGWFLHLGRQMIFPKMWLLKAWMKTEFRLQKLTEALAAISSPGAQSVLSTSSNRVWPPTPQQQVTPDPPHTGETLVSLNR